MDFIKIKSCWVGLISRRFSVGGFLALGILLFSTLSIPTKSFALVCTSTNTNGNWSTNATWTGCGGGTPGTNDTVIISTGAKVTLNISTTITELRIYTSNTNSSLIQLGTTTLTINGPVTFNQPTSNGIRVGWHIGAGTATVSGLITFGGTATQSRISSMTITSGQLNANGGITFSGTTASNKIILMSGGDGELNLKGALTGSANATLTGGTSGSIFNYADDTSAQTIGIFGGTGGYYNLHINNTSANGVTLGAAITATTARVITIRFIRPPHRERWLTGRATLYTLKC